MKPFKLNNEKWIEAIYDRLMDGMPYEDDNEIVANIVKDALEKNPTLIHSFIGTHIIEEDYFEGEE
jgi:hypothetical protein